jgi:NAD(P)-dependent dehydrogenase (short-subunit alcohol dehydrogenase family)
VARTNDIAINRAEGARDGRHDDQEPVGPGDRGESRHREGAGGGGAFNLSQSLRALLSARGVGVHAVLTGPTDTDMTRRFEIPKASPRSVARAILDGVQRGEEEIFPDPMSAAIADGWRSGVAKAFERENAACLAAVTSQAA